jgi:hypothetical protein
MSEYLSNLSTKDKVLFIGGGALVLFLLVKSLAGGSAPEDSGVLIDQSQAAAVAGQELKEDVQEALAAQAEQNADSAAALNEALVTQADNLLALFDGYKNSQHQEIAALQDTLEKSVDNQNDSISSLIKQMSKTPTYSDTSYSTGVQAKEKPKEKVVYGKSADLTDEAKSAFGSGYKFVNIDNVDATKLKVNENSITLGGTGIWGDNASVKNSTNLAGYDRYGTAAAVLSYVNN